MPERFRVRAKISGQVQGIGYRWFVQKTAAGLGLDGWVMNLPGGGVELEAAGEKPELENFLETLKTNHPWASVAGVETEWAPETGKTGKGFNIKF
jgi:acylphosphatase